MSKNLNDILLVGMDDNDPDTPTMTVGRRFLDNETTELIGCFQGESARMLYDILTGKAKLKEE